MEVSSVVKPKVCSKEWWKAIFSALNYKQYSARDWAIDTLSSARSYAGAGVLVWLKTTFWPSVVAVSKGLWIKVVALTLAVCSVIRDGVLALLHSA
jgi:hypothetical protein